MVFKIRCVIVFGWKAFLVSLIFLNILKILSLNAPFAQFSGDVATNLATMYLFSTLMGVQYERYNFLHLGEAM